MKGTERFWTSRLESSFDDDVSEDSDGKTGEDSDDGGKEDSSDEKEMIAHARRAGGDGVSEQTKVPREAQRDW